MTVQEPEVSPEIARTLGVTAEEYERLQRILGRDPNWTELGITSALWSEHCSYKSSKVYLKELPTSGPHVLQGPGENAGVVDVGHGWVAVFKMESHNHPSFIEPYQGSMTGVGGILRDIFTMGARPIACMDSLRFGELDAPRMRFLIDGVVWGIGDYGNCVGIPTVGGETGFHPLLQRQHPGQRLQLPVRSRRGHHVRLPDRVPRLHREAVPGSIHGSLNGILHGGDRTMAPGTNLIELVDYEGALPSPESARCHPDRRTRHREGGFPFEMAVSPIWMAPIAIEMGAFAISEGASPIQIGASRSRWRPPPSGWQRRPSRWR